jgi:hypothetical protein
VSRSRSWFRAKAGKRDKNHAPIRDGLRRLGCIVADLAGAADGVADLAVLPPGAPSGGWKWLEVKSDKGTLTDAQRLLHAQWAAKGVTVHVVRSLDEALAVVRT